MTNTYHQEKYQSNLTSHQGPSDCGLKQERSDVSDQMKTEEGSTMSLTSKQSLESPKKSRQEKQFAMQESVPVTKKKTLKGKSNSLEQNFQIQKSSKMLQVVSIGKDQDLIPFWNKSVKEMSKQLWSPIETDFVDLDQNLLNGSSKSTMSNSWFSTQFLTKKTPLTNSQRTYLQSLQSLLPEIMDSELGNIKEKENSKKQKKEKTPEQLEKIELKRQETIRKKKEKCIASGKVYKSQEEKAEEKLKNKQEKIKISQNGGKKYLDPDTKENAGKSKRVRVYFSQDQKQVLNNWFGITRFIYNRCLYHLKFVNPKASLDQLREKFIHNKNYKTENTWMLEKSVYDLRDEALRDLINNLRSNLAKGTKFSIQFKTKKDPIQSLSILGKYWNKPNSFFSNIFTPTLRTGEALPKTLLYTSRLIKDQIGQYYICIPEPLVPCETQAENSMVFIDPGCKNFLTCYDPSGKVFVVGKADIGKISRLLHYRKNLQSRTDKETNKKKKKRMKIATLKIYRKIENLVSEMHKKVCLWLVNNYNYIFLPRLNFHNMKILNKVSKQKMASLSHCSFLERLKNKTREYLGCKVLEVNESYTSKTCSRCGYQDNKLGNKDVYCCRRCNNVLGRDINAAKNIMLRYFSQRAVVVATRH